MLTFLILWLSTNWRELTSTPNDAQGDPLPSAFGLQGTETDWLAVALAVVLAVVTASFDLRQSQKEVPLHYDEHECVACKEPVKEVRYWLDGALVLSAQMLLGVLFWLLLLQPLSAWVHRTPCLLAPTCGSAPGTAPLEALVAPLLAGVALLMLIYYLGAARSQVNAATCVQTSRAERSFLERRRILARRFLGFKEGPFKREVRSLRRSTVGVYTAAAGLSILIPLAAALVPHSVDPGKQWLAGGLGLTLAYATVVLLLHFRDRARTPVRSGADRGAVCFTWLAVVSGVAVSMFLVLPALAANDSLRPARFLAVFLPLLLWGATLLLAKRGYEGPGPLTPLKTAAALSFASRLRSRHGTAQAVLDVPFDERTLWQKLRTPRAGKLRTVPDSKLGEVSAQVEFWDEVDPWKNEPTGGSDDEASVSRTMDINGPELASLVFTEGTVVSIRLTGGRLWRESCLTVTGPTFEHALKEVTVVAGSNSIPIRVDLEDTTTAGGTSQRTLPGAPKRLRACRLRRLIRTHRPEA